MVEFFDPDAVLYYAKMRDSALTAARVGFFIDQHCKTLMAEDKHLNALRKGFVVYGGASHKI